MILKYGSKSNSKQAVRAYRLLMGFSLEDTFTVALQTATKNFQREHGLLETGMADQVTIRELEAEKDHAWKYEWDWGVYTEDVEGGAVYEVYTMPMATSLPGRGLGSLSGEGDPGDLAQEH